MASADVFDFEGLTLGPESAWNGPDPSGEVVNGLYGPETLGGFGDGGLVFENRYRTTSGSWSGFGYSNTTDTTTPGFTNQFSAFTGGGQDSAQYGVAAGYLDAAPNCNQLFSFDPTNPQQLALLPTILLPEGESVQSVSITNTTYAALSMQQGDSFAKAFGGDSGDEPDWFRVTAYGLDAAGAPLGESAEFYLADYRFADNAEDYLLTEWAEWDLSALANARSLHFNLSSSDVGGCGMNTPGYFAIDNLVFGSGALAGDYNGDGNVDAADYTLWRDTLGDEVAVPGAEADGDASGRIDQGDWAVWRANYGSGHAASAAAIPEPSSLALLAALFAPCLRLPIRGLPGNSVSLLWINDS